MQKFRNPFASDRRDNAKLGKTKQPSVDAFSWNAVQRNGSRNQPRGAA
jgi:hypothetical protein